MIADGRIPIRGGQFIDAYNQSVGEVSGTIRRTYDSSNMHFVTEVTPQKKKAVIPIGCTPEVAVTVTSRCGMVTGVNLMGTDHYPMNGVLEVYMD